MQKYANAAEFYLHHMKAIAMWFAVLAGQLATSLAPSGPACVRRLIIVLMQIAKYSIYS